LADTGDLEAACGVNKRAVTLPETPTSCRYSGMFAGACRIAG